MDTRLIERYSHPGEGYMPSLITRPWQAAFLNYAPAEALEAITKLDIHHLTDEAFVLLKGHVVLIAAKLGGETVEYELIDMVPEVIYNIPRNTWHKVAMEPGSSLLIVENARTHESDFEYFDLSDTDKCILCQSVCDIKRKR